MDRAEKNLDELRCLTLKQTAELLRVSLRTLESMVKRKQLPVVRVGRQWRVHKGTLEKWMVDHSLDEL